MIPPSIKIMGEMEYGPRWKTGLTNHFGPRAVAAKFFAACTDPLMARHPKSRKVARRRPRKQPRRSGPVGNADRPTPLPKLLSDSLRTVRATNELITMTASDYAAMLTWKLSDLGSYTEFATLFDYYSLTRIVLVFSFVGTGSAGPANIMIASDYDGGSAPSLSTILQHRVVSKKLSPTFPSASFSLVPRVSMEVYDSSGGAAASGIGKPNQILDLASPGISHYGAAVYARNANTSNSGFGFTIDTYYHLRFSGVR